MKPLTKKERRYVAMKLIALWSLTYYKSNHWMELSNLAYGMSTRRQSEIEGYAMRIHETAK